MMVAPPFYSSPGGSSPIFSSLEFFLEFEQNDASSTFIDSCGNWNFSVRNTAGATTTSAMSGSGGPIAEGRYGFPNTTEGNSIYIPTAAGFKLPNADFTFGGVVTTLTNAGGLARFLMGNVGATATDFQAYIAIDGVDNQYHFYCTTNGAVSGRVDLDSTQNPHATDATLLAATLDRANNLMIFRAQRVGSPTPTKVSIAFPGAIYTGATTANFCINDGLSSDNTYFASDRACVDRVDKAFLALRAFTDDDFDHMFNGGAFRPFSEL